MTDPKTESIRQASLSDQATEQDALGFTPYVEAIAEFLLSAQTKPPLTLSIEGEWGSGKSSFMKQLKAYLEKKGGRTVWFNAWRHDQAEQVWAAFALSFIQQISTAKSWQEVPRSVWGWIKLYWFRFNKSKGGLELAKVGVLFLLVVCLALAIPILLIGGEVSAIQQLVRITQSPALLATELQAVVKLVGTTTGLAVSGTGLMAAVRALMGNLLKLVKSPTQNLLQYIESPDYQKRTGFVEEFHEDFAKIVDAYVGDNNKVYVFIDDLDRCEHPKSADLMQALNLMIAEDPSVIFILGMDREKVAASLAVKFKDVLDFLPDESASINPEILAKRIGNRGLAYGYTFIEKFIQLPFQVPQPVVQKFDNFFWDLIPTQKKDSKSWWQPLQTGILGIYYRLEELGLGLFRRLPYGIQKALLGWRTNSGKQGKQNRSNLAEQPPTRSATGDQPDADANQTPQWLANLDFDSPEASQIVRDVVRMVAPALDYNPRRIKAFINVFRLKTFIAGSTGLLDQDPPVTLQQLGKFTALSLKWPLFLLDLDRDRTLLQEMCRYQFVDAETFAQAGERVRYWLEHDNGKLRCLITAGCNMYQYNHPGQSNRTTRVVVDEEYNLETLDVNQLLQVSPQVIYQAKLGDRWVRVPKIEMVDIPAGSFWMGSGDDDPEAYDYEKPRHKVTLQAFQMGKYPVTQAQYEAVMGTNPSGFSGNPNHPVERVSWHGAQEFCRRLSQITGQVYRLPTEAEWEYACRAGTETRYYFGDEKNKLENYAWYRDNSDQKTHPVGEKQPNSWGLYDMHGNVWEWCADSWHDSYVTKPSRLKQQGNEPWVENNAGSYVICGGSWNDDPRDCRSADRYWSYLDNQLNDLGFRVACRFSRS